MKRAVAYAAIALFIVCTLESACAANESLITPQPGARQQTCYTLAMIGKDFVINARLGVLPERSIELATISSSVDNDTYDSTLLNIMLEAYLWPDSPHSYALNVLENCLSEGSG